MDLGFPFSKLLQQGTHVFSQGGFERVEFAVSILEMEGQGVECKAGEEGAFLFFGF